MKLMQQLVIEAGDNLCVIGLLSLTVRTRGRNQRDVVIFGSDCELGSCKNLHVLPKRQKPLLKSKHGLCTLSELERLTVDLELANKTMGDEDVESMLAACIRDFNLISSVVSIERTVLRSGKGSR